MVWLHPMDEIVWPRCGATQFFGVALCALNRLGQGEGVFVDQITLGKESPLYSLMVNPAHQPVP